MLLRALLLAVATAVLAGGCGSAADDWSAPHARPTAVGTLGPGFVDPDHPPPPESTIAPRPGSWDEVHPPEGYRVVLLTTGDDAPTKALVDSVRSWADEEDVSVKTIAAAGPDQYIASITRAIDLAPDLVISAGNELVDALALVTAAYLGQQFLVLGAQVAEPTGNVTAADWAGASYRGEGLGLPPAFDPATFTPERAGRAIRAGVAAVLHGLTGLVILVD